jgi:hypothetical protein
VSGGGPLARIMVSMPSPLSGAFSARSRSRGRHWETVWWISVLGELVRVSMLETLEDDDAHRTGTQARVAAWPHERERPKLGSCLGSMKRGESRGRLPTRGARAVRFYGSLFFLSGWVRGMR